MKILDIYDFDEQGNERYKQTNFYKGKNEYLGKSHGFSYMNAREIFKKVGKVMGLEKEVSE